MRRIFLSALVLLLFTSCGLLNREDTYVDATVGQAISGSVESETATYKLHDVDVIALEEDYALLHDDHHLAILSGDGLEDTLASLEGTDYSLLVRNWANPYPHFRLRGIQVGEETRPMSWVLADSELPTLMDRKVYNLDFFESVDLAGWKETPPAIGMVDKQILVNGNLAREVEMVEDEPAEAAETAEAADAGGEEMEGEAAQPAMKENVRYFIVQGEVRIEITPVAENGVRLLLEGIAAEGKAARYGGFMTKVNRSRERNATGSYGTFQLSVFDFGGKICILR